MNDTTLRKLRKNYACDYRYRHLVLALGDKYGDDEPIPLVRILEINELDDAIWALRTLEDDRRARLFACRCVRETPLGDGRTVWDLLTDARSRRSVETAEAWCRGAATDEELAVACADAFDTARDTCDIVSGEESDAALAAACTASPVLATAVYAAAREATLTARRNAEAARDAQAGIFREMFGGEEERCKARKS